MIYKVRVEGWRQVGRADGVWVISVNPIYLLEILIKSVCLWESESVALSHSPFHWFTMDIAARFDSMNLPSPVMKAVLSAFGVQDEGP